MCVSKFGKYILNVLTVNMYVFGYVLEGFL